ncbi:MAG: hypothetical protein LBP28_01255 [Coriobacteriales bacterium]|jgi:X-X-X-Leu-X-X-Gly heptad repeat protein|nr:hypothetical protein [Coriobacteriales bacterium]
MRKKTVAAQIISIVVTVALLVGLGAVGTPTPAAEASVTSAGEAQNAIGTGRAVAYSTSEEAIADGPAVYTKNENVYARLSQDGALREAYTVNAFSVSKSGAITDHGAYDKVQNLTDLNEVKVAGDVITFKTDRDNFYYEGDIAAAQLPWKVKIAYTLDGKKVDADALAGAAGKLDIRITTEQNTAADPIFYNNYLLQVSVVLNTDKCKNIQAKDASVVDAGTSKNINFTVMPKKSGDLALSADVTDFEMDGIQIAAVPFSMGIEIPDTSEMTDGMTDLKDGIGELNDGAHELSDGLAALSDNAGEIKNGADEIGSGLSQISANKGSLISGSQQILDGLGGLSGGLSQTGAGIDALHGGYAQAYQALDGAMGGFKGLSPEQLGAIGAYLADPSSDQTAVALFAPLFADYVNALTAKGTYDATKPAFAAVDTQLAAGTDPANPTLKDGLTQIQGGLAQLAGNYATFNNGLITYTNGISALAGGYGSYDEGLAKYLDGVVEAGDGTSELANGTQELAEETSDLPERMDEEIQKMRDEFDYSGFVPVSFVDAQNENIGAVQFVIQTDPIKKPDAADAVDESPAPEGFWDRLLALFKSE